MPTTKLEDLRQVRNTLMSLHTSHNEGRVLKHAVLELIEIIGPPDLNDDETESAPPAPEPVTPNT